MKFTHIHVLARIFTPWSITNITNHPPTSPVRLSVLCRSEPPTTGKSITRQLFTCPHWWRDVETLGFEAVVARRFFRLRAVSVVAELFQDHQWLVSERHYTKVPQGSANDSDGDGVSVLSCLMISIQEHNNLIDPPQRYSSSSLR